MQKRATIYDIAKEAGVSTATVTRVVNRDPRVRNDTRARVQSVIDSMGYTPSAFARQLDANGTKTLGIILPNINHPYFSRVFSAAYDEARLNGYDLFLFPLESTEPFTREFADKLISRRLDGVLFAGSIWNAERPGLQDTIARLRQNMAVVALCPAGVELNCTCIHVDMNGCPRIAVKHLYTLGHRRIAYIGDSPMDTNAETRRNGFLSALAELGLTALPGSNTEYASDTESGERALSHLLGSMEPSQWPTAIVTFNDMVALGAMKQIKKLGLRIPQDMALVSCDNSFFCPYTDPPLTSIDLHPDEYTRSCIRELIHASEASEAPINIDMHDVTLVIRESCGARLGYRTMSR